MEDGAVGHGAGQVGAKAAVGGHLQLQPGDLPLVIKAHIPLVAEGVALASDHEVVIAVQAQLDGAAKLACRQGRPDGQMPGLRLFAAKAPAHAAALHRDGMRTNAQRVGHPLLHFARVLGAGVHQPLVLLLGNDVGNLPFQVKVLLPAHFQRALQAVRGAGQTGVGIAAPHMHGRQHKALPGNGHGGVQHRSHCGDVCLDFACGTARGHDAVGHHQPHDLADVPDLVERKNGLVMAKGGEDGVTWYIGSQHHTVHAGHGQGIGAIQSV